MNKKIQDKINDLNPCDDCEDIQIKKFSPITNFEDYDLLNDDYFRCSCGKRPLDVVMAHILKIMIEQEIVSDKATLRRNSPIPMPAFCYSYLNPQFIGRDDLILIHPDFDKEVAMRLVNEVTEVKGVLKGDAKEVVGILDVNSEPVEFELLAGKSDRIDVLRAMTDDLIVISKDQRNSHIEVAPTTEDKLLKVYNYLDKECIEKNMALDGMCGSGAIGIFLLKYGFKKVIFNDINPQAIINLKNNLKLNNIDENSYEIFNEPVENLNSFNCDLVILDAFPGVDTENIEDYLESFSSKILKI